MATRARSYRSGIRVTFNISILSTVDHLSDLSDLSALSVISYMSDLSDLSALPDLVDVFGICALSDLTDLSDLPDLSGISDISDLSDLTDVVEEYNSRRCVPAIYIQPCCRTIPIVTSMGQHACRCLWYFWICLSQRATSQQWSFLLRSVPGAPIVISVASV